MCMCCKYSYCSYSACVGRAEESPRNVVSDKVLHGCWSRENGTYQRCSPCKSMLTWIHLVIQLKILTIIVFFGSFFLRISAVDLTKDRKGMSKPLLSFDSSFPFSFSVSVGEVGAGNDQMVSGNPKEQPHSHTRAQIGSKCSWWRARWTSGIITINVRND